MIRTVYYGYNPNGEFQIRIYERSAQHDDPDKEQFAALTRAECNKISNHMKFGKKGDERVMEFVNGKEVK